VPAVDDATIAADLDDWLGPLLHDAVSVSDVARLDVAAALLGRIGWHHRAELDRLVPEQWTLPSGRTVDIDYTRERPTISGRVQEFYGRVITPAVLDGAVPLTVELLSPANRPVQVTSDLAGFWAGSWVEVRKEMAGRYPKHRWPEDPTT
jgi:ATP-dependent helicase HrpB